MAGFVHVSNFIIDFLCRSEKDIAAITGEWGTGKTFIWEKTIEETVQGKLKPSLRKIAYVSLFGLDTVDAVKLAIFEELRDFEVQAAAGNQSHHIVTNIASRGKILARKVLPHADHLPMIGDYFKVASAFYFSSVRDAIVCFDDLERRSANLPLGAIMGLAHFLKDRRGCKVIFLLNKNELSEVDAFEKYHEKTFDVSISLSPNPKECAELVFSTDDIHHRAAKCSEFLSIKNIRILKKIQRRLDYLTSFLPVIHDHVAQQLASTSVLLTWCFLRGQDAPPMDFVLQHNSLQSMYQKESWTSEQKRWAKMLNDYKYTSTDEIDRQIAQHVTLGFLDEVLFRDLVIAANQNSAAYEMREKYRRTWKLFNSSFSVDEDTFVRELCRTFIESVSALNCHNANEVVWVLSDLGQQERAADLIEKFKLEHCEKPKDFWVKADYLTSDRGFHPLVAELMDVMLTKFNSGLDILKTLEMLGKDEYSWQDADVTLRNVTETELYTAFKSTDFENHRNVIKAALYWDNVVNSSAQHRQFTVKVKSALYRMACESNIQRLRLKSWGVTTEAEEDLNESPE